MKVLQERKTYKNGKRVFDVRTSRKQPGISQTIERRRVSDGRRRWEEDKTREVGRVGRAYTLVLSSSCDDDRVGKEGCANWMMDATLYRCESCGFASLRFEEERA